MMYMPNLYYSHRSLHHTGVGCMILKNTRPAEVLPSVESFSEFQMPADSPNVSTDGAVPGLRQPEQPLSQALENAHSSDSDFSEIDLSGEESVRPTIESSEPEHVAQ